MFGHLLWLLLHVSMSTGKYFIQFVMMVSSNRARTLKNRTVYYQFNLSFYEMIATIFIWTGEPVWIAIFDHILKFPEQIRSIFTQFAHK
ncbi:unnamed protein product [Bathycoccus prasinos]